MSDRAALLDLMERTAQGMSDLGVLLREQAKLIRTEQESGDKAVSLGTAAARLEVSQKTIRRLIESKQLTKVRVGRLVRVSESSIAAYQQRRTA